MDTVRYLSGPTFRIVRARRGSIMLYAKTTTFEVGSEWQRESMIAEFFAVRGGVAVLGLGGATGACSRPARSPSGFIPPTRR